MERRDILRALAGTGGLLAFEGCSGATSQGSASDGNIQAAAAELAGTVLQPGQSAAAREALATMRFTGDVDAEVQPALMFDPEVDVE